MKTETKIQNTNLNTSIKKILSICNIYTIEDLLRLDIERLKRIRGLGNKRIKEILNLIKENGLHFNN